MNNDRTAVLVRGVADLLRKGWTQRAGARNRNGRRVDPRDPSAVAWCLLGAIDCVVRMVEEAEELLARFDVRVDSVAAWNDAPGRTVGQVLELCRLVEEDLA